MENLELILSLAGTGVGLLITLLTFIVKYCRSSKARKMAEQAIEVANAVLPYIEQAEKFVNFSGEEKKEYVMTKANQYAIQNNIKFDSAAVSQKVEELITLTKQVNVKSRHNCNLNQPVAKMQIKGLSGCVSGCVSE